MERNGDLRLSAALRHMPDEGVIVALSESEGRNHQQKRRLAFLRGAHNGFREGTAGRIKAADGVSLLNGVMKKLGRGDNHADSPFT